MDIFLICFFVFITGACIGSFLNVVALRALTNESIIFPPSKCPKCSNPIKWYDNIPIFSYFFTFKGKCRNCKEKVSIQYPIVEFATAIIFLSMFILFGFTLKTLLLLILSSVSTVIFITDMKKEYVFEVHAWILIIISIISALYIDGLENYLKPAIGLIAAVITMEAIARLSYFLVRKKQSEKNDGEKTEDEEYNLDTDDENFDINEYIKKKKRAFGEGDTYLAAASGALLGWKYFIAALFISIVLQALFILPQFIKGLYNQKHYRLIFSLISFFVMAIIYWIISNIVELNLYITMIFVVLLIFFAIDTINRLKNVVNEQGFSAIPFGPTLLTSTFIIFFFGEKITKFLFNHIFTL